MIPGILLQQLPLPCQIDILDPQAMPSQQNGCLLEAQHFIMSLL